MTNNDVATIENNLHFKLAIIFGHGSVTPTLVFFSSFSLLFLCFAFAMISKWFVLAVGQFVDCLLFFLCSPMFIIFMGCSLCGT